MFMQLRHAARLLTRTPGFTIAAVVCLALGIAVNTTIFSLFDALVLHPFAYPEPDRLLSVRGVFQRIEPEGLSGPEAAAIRSVPSVAALALFDFANRNLTGIETPQRLFTAIVGTETFAAYGMGPILGRAFTPEEHRADMGVVIISHRLWQRQYGSDNGMIGRKIGINGRPHTVVGILPPRFVLGAPGMGGAELYLPVIGDAAGMHRNNRQYQTVVRLRPGGSLQQFQSELQAIARRNEQDHASEIPEYKGWTLTAVPLAKSINPLLRATAGILLGAVVAVMLIACVNVANLILARAARRSREVAIRRAIGATRLHLLSQYFAEGLLLSLLAGSVGVLLALWGLDVLLALLPKHMEVLPPGVQVAINTRVLAFIAAVVLGTAVVFGLVPALQGQREGLTASLHQGARGTSNLQARRLTDILVITEVALSLVLLIGTGLAIRSYLKLTSVDPGFNPENVLIMRTTLPVNKYSPPQITAFFKQLQERISQLPGVKSAGVANQFPPAGFAAATFEGEGLTRVDPILTVASTGFFGAIALPLQKGRLFSEVDDTVDSPLVVVVNQQFAKAMFRDEEAVGKRVRLAGNQKAEWATVIGVVGSARNRGLDKAPQPEVYIPLAKDRGNWNQLWVAVRTAGEPLSTLAGVREQMRAIDPDQPVYLAMAMREAVRFTTLPQRAAAWLLAVFGGLAMLLATVGLYGVVAYTVARRTPEIGVRVALGAPRNEILRLVLRNGMKLAFAGIAIGAAAGAVLASFAGKLLYGVDAHDWITFAGASALLLATTLLASYLPARRATRVDPIVALRHD